MYFIEGYCDMIFIINLLKIRYSLNINGFLYFVFNLRRYIVRVQLKWDEKIVSCYRIKDFKECNMEIEVLF